MPAKKEKIFAPKLDPVLKGTLQSAEGTKALFVTKGVIFLTLAFLILFNQELMGTWVMFLFGGLMVLNGLAMIVAGLLDSARSRDNMVWQLVFGGAAILVGAVPILWPELFAINLAQLMILGVSLEGLYAIIYFLFMFKNGLAKWWAIASGMPVIFVGIGIWGLADQALSAILIQKFVMWLAMYAKIVGIIYVATPFLFSFSGRQAGGAKITATRAKKTKSQVKRRR